MNTLPVPSNDVLNGIARDAQRKRLFVTGKHWLKLFGIKLVRWPSESVGLWPTDS